MGEDERENVLRYLERKEEYVWSIKRHGAMNVDGRIYASSSLMENIKKDNTLVQLRNVATLPGIVKYALAMPDAHEGYGFPIGGVAGFDIREGGIISPGGVGFDINCGVRLVRTDLNIEEVMPYRDQLINEIFRNVPSGLGKGAKIKFSKEELLEILVRGVRYVIENGFGWREDSDRIEEEGNIKNASFEDISKKAMERGRVQIGSLGSGNHFLELQVVDKVYDEKVAGVMGIKGEGQIVVMVHTGSRGLGHQVASDFLLEMEKYIDVNKLADRELVSVEFESELGERYFKAMNAAANFAFANRQLITHWIRESFEKVFDREAKDMGMNIVYDVAHNIAKVEDHDVDGEKRRLIVHRKGATRSLGKGNRYLPSMYRSIGQPILIPGSMGTASYLLVGTQKAEQVSFSSTAHGAGRVMSRKKAIKSFTKEQIQKEMVSKGIYVRSDSWRGIVEEAPQVYKDIDEVVKVSHELGIGNIVARLRPIGVVKG